MHFVLIYGPPAVGKLTVARALQARTGWRLFHNHQTVDLALSVYDFGTPGFVALREAIWWAVFRQAAADALPGLIFTFNPENSVPQRFIDELFTEMTARGAPPFAVCLDASEATLERRLSFPTRREYRKLVDLDLYRSLRAKGVFRSPVLPAPRLTLDTEVMNAEQAAEAISAAFPSKAEPQPRTCVADPPGRP
ncbi:MAG TPA: AAA family ATPase [Opitutaceae bacterium]|jgi:hypothetical protein